jgi:hypothetical protein
MKTWFIGAAMAALSLASQAYQFSFTGQITYTDGSLSNTTVGQTFTGTFSGTNPQDQYAAYGLQGMAYYTFSSGQMQASISGHQIIGNSPRISLTDNFGGNVEDGFSASGGYSLTIDTHVHANGSFGLVLNSAPGHTDVLRGTSLPTQIDVAQFDAQPSLNYGYVQRDGGQTGRVIGFSVLSVSMPAVPEPSMVWLALAGLGATAAMARRPKA